MGRSDSRDAGSGASRQDSSAFDFTPKYMWTNTGSGGPKGVSTIKQAATVWEKYLEMNF